MKYFTRVNWLFLIVFAFCIFSNGCSPKNRKDSSLNDTNGILQDRGQGVCLDVNSGRMWQIERGGRFSSSQEAEQYAANLILGGYDDWRLPNKTELYNLHYIFSFKQNGNCNLKRTGEYWALDKESSILGHWETYILCGPYFKYVKSVGTKGYVRAVRP